MQHGAHGASGRCVLLMVVGLATCNAYAVVTAIPEDDPSTGTTQEVSGVAHLPLTISNATVPYDQATLPTFLKKEDAMGFKRADQKIQMGSHNRLREAMIDIRNDIPTEGPHGASCEEAAEEPREPTTELTQNVTVMISGGFKAALKKLLSQYEAKSGYEVILVPGPSMGQSPQAIPNRLARGEKADVVIMVGDALTSLEKGNWTQPGSRTELADSSIGMVVKKGDPWPDIKTVTAFRNTLLEAKSIAYSDSASGTYISSQLFKKLGIEDRVKDKAHMIECIPVASEVAKGNYALGFQQVSELLPVHGVDLVGEVPDEVQLITRYAGAVIAEAVNQKEGEALLSFLSSPEAQDIIHAAGLRSVRAENGGSSCRSSHTANAVFILLALITILF
ncbi:aconitate isomerase-like isoform X2 [Thrips palmi]|uniref:Aconitate isomerase-like isoform X2 n=1 Tax=Thrips palmi TaxID=161013 RepID=A0A6P8ZA91_THRPL|nr:aconitate isomerase-like isoform X2 [Thrips palmi]